MGERKGQNMYYPPDYDPGKGGLNKSQGTHALRERARKLHLGILIIRFEMPYNIWCEGCGNHIGMGVRYNAEKKKVGMYYTTPIYLFRMKCHLCDNHFEIKTDPANLDYEIITGARRQEKRFQAEENGTVVPDEKSEIAKLATDSMFKLQHDGIDRRKAKDSAPTISKIVQIQDRTRDDYQANRLLRDAMRGKRKAAKLDKIASSELMARAGLKGSGVNLLPEDKSDSQTAALLRLASVSSSEEKQESARDAIMEAGSSFTFAKGESAIHGSKSISCNDKERKIDNFRKIVARKRQRDGIATCPVDLGIKKNAKLKSKITKKSDQNLTNPSTEFTSPSLDDPEVTLKCDENLKPISSVTDKRDIEKACNETTKKNKEHDARISTSSEPVGSPEKPNLYIENRDEPVKSSLALISNYDSSNGSSDEQ